MDETKVFIVQRMGVYGQGISGVFLTRNLAEMAAARAKREEPDDRHTFEILELEVNTYVILVPQVDIAKELEDANKD